MHDLVGTILAEPGRMDWVWLEVDTSPSPLVKPAAHGMPPRMVRTDVDVATTRRNVSMTLRHLRNELSVAG